MESIARALSFFLLRIELNLRRRTTAALRYRRTITPREHTFSAETAWNVGGVKRSGRSAVRNTDLRSGLLRCRVEYRRTVQSDRSAAPAAGNWGAESRNHAQNFELRCSQAK